MPFVFNYDEEVDCQGAAARAERPRAAGPRRATARAAAAAGPDAAEWCLARVESVGHAGQTNCDLSFGMSMLRGECD